MTASTVWGQPDFKSTAPNRATPGSVNGFNMPVGLAVDAKGSVFVADLQNGRLLRFPPGSTSADWTVGSLGAGPHRVGSGGLAVDAAGHLYAAALDSSLTGIVVRYSPPSTTPDMQWSAPGATAVAVDASGNVYVAEVVAEANAQAPVNRVQRYPAGSKTADLTWGS
jgi:streptogramin lyase